jgi:hypothetical protein
LTVNLHRVQVVALAISIRFVIIAALEVAHCMYHTALLAAIYCCYLTLLPLLLLLLLLLVLSAAKYCWNTMYLLD